jgi:hypothetical protein
MDVKGVLSRGHVVQVQLDLYSLAGVFDSGATHVSSTSVFHVHFNGAGK